MPRTTLERLERIVDQSFAAKGSYKELLSKPEAPPQPAAGGFTRAAAWGILVLLLTVPLFAVFGSGPNLAWILWAIISGWAALDSRNIGAALSSPKRPVIAGRMIVLGMAVFNLFTALYAIFVPFVGHP